MHSAFKISLCQGSKEESKIDFRFDGVHGSLLNILSHLIVKNQQWTIKIKSLQKMCVETRKEEKELRNSPTDSISKMRGAK